MRIPEICDDQVAILRLALELPGVNKALMPATSWLGLADRSEGDAADLSGALIELRFVRPLEFGVATAASSLKPELDKLQQIAAECKVRARNGTGTAEKFLKLSLAQYQLAQGARLAVFSLFVGAE